MAKFNRQAKGQSPAGGSRTTNYEGAPAYTLSKEMELYSAVVTSSLSDSFYEKSGDRAIRVRDLIKQCSPEFVAKLAVYTREQMYLRTIPLVLVVELAKIHSGDSLVSRLTSRVIQRADEITELLAYYQLANQRTGKEAKKLGKLSKQIQLGLAQSFNKFDSYQFSKYSRGGEISLKDALFLVHPKAITEEQQALFDRIVKDELETAYTWETELSALGQQKFEDENAKKDAFKEKWEELIDSNRLGYMALLRNLKNILEANVSKSHIQKVADRLANQREVARSKQLPFRFFSAYLSLLGEARVTGKFKPVDYHTPGFATGNILYALDEAIKASVVNVKGFAPGDDVLICIDFSGSMQSPISQKSSVCNVDIGIVLGSTLRYKCRSVALSIFGDSAKMVTLSAGNVLENALKLRHLNDKGEVGHSTNGHLAIRLATEKALKATKVCMFTDCQLWDSNHRGISFDGYQSLSKAWRDFKKISPDARLFLFDLSGYGDTPISVAEEGVYLIAGWSDKVFDVLDAIENGSSALEKIKAIDL